MPMVGGSCVFLRDDGCAVYEVRPQACRDQSSSSCGAWSPDAEKIAGRVRLRVVS